MEKIKEVLEEIKFISNEIEKIFKRLEEIGLIEIGCEVTKKPFIFYSIEKSWLETKIKIHNDRLKELRKKDIVGLNGEVE